MSQRATSRETTRDNPDVATSLRVLDILRDDERPAEQTMGGEAVANRYEVSANDFYTRGFSIARALRAWRNHTGEGPHPGLPAPSGLEQAVDRVCNLSDADFQAATSEAKGRAAGDDGVGRARAIEAVRLLVTALIRQQSGGPVNLHIVSDEESKTRWRLFEAQPALDF